MINLKDFLKSKSITFDSDKKALSWVRSLRPNTLVRIGSSYFIDEEEMLRLMDIYFNKQIDLRKKRAAKARKMFSKSNVKKNSLGGKDSGSKSKDVNPN